MIGTTLRSAVLSLPILLLCAAAQATAQTGGTALKPFLGSWKGTCGDGKTFVILNLRLEGTEVAGTVSMANMQGAEGQCETVVDPPSDEHAMKVSDARLEGKALAFQGSPQARFTMTVAGDGAQLKFLGTPVEDNPWKLTRVP